MTEIYSDYVTASPESVETGDIKFNTIKTTFEDKKKQVALKSSDPEQTWRLKYSYLTDAELGEIFDFYDARRGAYEAFYWYHPFDETTLINTENIGATVLELNDTMRIRIGDYVRVDEDDAEIHEVVAKSTGTSITIAAAGLNAQKIAGSKIQVRYKVRFVTLLSWDTVKTWLRDIGISLERVIE